MEYSMPIRVRWDVDFRGRAGRTKRIARRIREASPLFVELRVDGEKGLTEFPAVFSEIHKGDARIEATFRLSPKTAAAARRGYPIDFIWKIGAREPFTRLLPDGARAISFVPDEDTYPDLPDILEEFAESGLDTLHLPNVNAVKALAEKGHVPIPRRSQLQEAAEHIPALRVSLSGKKIVVHDFFLWRVLRGAFPNEVGERVEFSGCQAGSALAHVDWEGNVYPCDSLPILLGSLEERSFEAIWDAPARKQVLSAIRSVPAPCGSCDSLKGCLSGCRGLAYVASGTLEATDPCCTVGTTPHGSKT